jgi:hypothetical protein
MTSAARLPWGTLAAAIGALLGAVVWAAISTATGYQIGYMAVLVGFLAGLAMRLVGGGRDRADGIVAALVALAGCVLGNSLMIAFEATKELRRPLPAVLFGLIVHPAVSLKLLELAFTPMDLVFYAIAAYAGYRTASKASRGAAAGPPQGAPAPAKPSAL